MVPPSISTVKICHKYRDPKYVLANSQQSFYNEAMKNKKALICYFLIIVNFLISACQSKTTIGNCAGKVLNGQREGLWVCSEPNGQKTEINFKAGLKDGRMSIYFLDGKLSTQVDWKNNVQEGELISYYPSGKINLYSQMANGKLGGANKEWDENGQLLTECHYQAGVRSGPCLTWYSNGKPESKATYVDNKLDGPYEDWYESGVQRSKSTYKLGQRTSGQFWTADGSLTKESFDPYD